MTIAGTGACAFAFRELHVAYVLCELSVRSGFRFLCVGKLNIVD